MAREFILKKRGLANAATRTPVFEHKRSIAKRFTALGNQALQAMNRALRTQAASEQCPCSLNKL
jgi:hypothetical protein